MKNRFPIFALTICLLFGAATLGHAAPTYTERKVNDVSIINLIATPEKYNGELVRVSGYISLDFEGRAIYLSEADYDHAIYKNALWVSFQREAMSDDNLKSMDKHYVTVLGTFDSTSLGHMGLFSGTLQGISKAWRRRTTDDK